MPERVGGPGFGDAGLVTGTQLAMSLRTVSYSQQRQLHLNCSLYVAHLFVAQTPPAIE